ncbi:MAG: TRAP transporter substrate-binding protein DctP [Deltaproteobacteria bacterium]|jgi:TRAP-type C4-dicarboxylate transport system substrate-binding protein|nr:TRAP transporter substrate-binding protein DctP [Deltaproteobacteria bacterium]
MKIFIKILSSLFIIFVISANIDKAEAARPKYLLKIASIAPEGSVWAKRFRDFAKEVVEKSDGEIGFKIYAGGVMGDDRSMYRKMRVGQLNGGGFTMTGIGDVVPDFRVLGIPFMFNSYDEVDRLKEKLMPRFEKEFDNKGLVLMAVTEVGFVYTMSTTPITTLAELKQSKPWAPEGDPISYVLLETVGVTPIPLSIPDVLTSLQTGLINTTFNSYYGSIVLQWFTRISYITDIPFAYAYGAFVLDKKTFSRLPPHYMEVMKSAAKTHFNKLLEDTRKSNEEAMQVLIDNDITLVKPTPMTRAELQNNYREKAVEKLVDEAFSRSIYKEAMKHLEDYQKELSAIQQ